VVAIVNPGDLSIEVWASIRDIVQPTIAITGVLTDVMVSDALESLAVPTIQELTAITAGRGGHIFQGNRAFASEALGEAQAGETFGQLQERVIAAGGTGVQAEAIAQLLEIPIGADLRDYGGAEEGSNGVAAGSGVGVVAGGTIVLSRLLPLVPVALRSQLFQWVPRVGTTIGWSSLPGWLRTVMSGLGFTGLALLIDGVTDFEALPNIPGIGGGGGGGDHVMHGAAVVGSWVANGVVFYRLADGKLAVQNKKGRWKVWRPKRPVVLYSGGSINIKTLIKADKIVTKQAKQLSSILNRRAPKRKSPSKSGDSVIVAAHSVPVAQLTSGR